MNNFSRIASIYDPLAKLVFGHAIRESQTAQFNVIKPNQKILLVGGGTGWILSELDKLGISLKIDYVDKSSKMIEMAQRRAPFNNLTVDFVSADILEHRALDYDVLMTHFFLDVFNQNCFKKVFRHLNKMLLKNGVWVNTEFVSSNSFIRSIFIRFMYLFFRITANLQSYGLPKYEEAFLSAGFKKRNSTLFYHQLIESCIYTRS